LLAYSKALPAATDCSDWLQSFLAAGVVVAVPEIGDYEVRRELLRLGRSRGIRRLDTQVSTTGILYLPLSTAAMRRAAEFWAEARRRGRPTADAKALDGDVILAAQAVLAAPAGDDVTIATTNVGHLSLFVHAQEWWTISPDRNGVSRS
jgi:hypothetical protein